MIGPLVIGVIVLAAVALLLFAVAIGMALQQSRRPELLSGGKNRDYGPLDTLHVCWGFWDDAPPPPHAGKHWHNHGIRQTRVWSKAQSEALIRRHFPWAVPGWEGAVPIQQADMARYAIVAVKGGWYADLDAVIGVAAGEDAKIALTLPALLRHTVDIDGKTPRRFEPGMAIGCIEAHHRKPHQPWSYVGNFGFYAPAWHPWPIEMLRDAALNVLIYPKPVADPETKRILPSSQQAVIMSAGPGSSNRTAIVNDPMHAEDVDARTGKVLRAAVRLPPRRAAKDRKLRRDITLLPVRYVANTAASGWRHRKKR